MSRSRVLIPFPGSGDLGAEPRRSRRRPPTAPRHLGVGRAERAGFARWALQHGRSIDRDAATVLLAVVGPLRPAGLTLTDEVVTELVWIDAVRWCDQHGFDLPDRFAETLHAFVDHADHCGFLHPGSDAADELHRTITWVGAPDHHPQRPFEPVPTA